MPNQTLGLLFKASGDFSHVAQSALHAAREMQRHFGPQSPLGKLGGDQVGLFQRIMGGRAVRSQSDSTRVLNSVREAIERTHQSGKRLRDLDLSGQFGEAAKYALNIQRSMDRAANSIWGKDLKRRVKASGQDWENPQDWDWDKFRLGNASETRKARAQFLSGSERRGDVALAAPEERAEHAGAHSGVAYSGSIVHRAEQFGKHETEVIAKTIAGLAIGGGIASLIVSASRESFRLGEDIDYSHKALSGDRTFLETKDAARDLGHELEMAGSEAAKLAKEFIHTSGSIDPEVFERMQEAGKLGHGYGVSPGQTSRFFAQAELSGYATSKQGQREFAALLAQTIASSGTFANTDKVMGDVVGHIREIAATFGRVATENEVGAYSSYVGQFYENRALFDGGGDRIMEALNRLGSGESAIDQNFAWQAFGNQVGMDPVRVMMMSAGHATQSANDIFPNENLSRETIGELKFKQLLRLSESGEGRNERERFSWAGKKYMGMDVNTAGATYDFMKRFKPAGQPGSHSDYVDWAKIATGKDLEDIDMSGHMRLSKLWIDKDKPLAERKDNLIAMGKEYQDDHRVTGELKTKLNEAMALSGEAQLRALSEILPKIIAETGTPEDEAKKNRAIQEEMTNALSQLGDHINRLVLVLKEPVGPALEKIADFLGYWFGDGIDREIPAGTSPADAELIMEGRRERRGDETEHEGEGIIDGARRRIGERQGVRQVLDTIAVAETGPGRNPNAVHGDPNQSSVDFTSMKVRDVIAWQRANRNKAVGRYQFKPDTLEEEAKRAGPGYLDAPFSTGLQGYLAEQLARRHGMREWLRGEGTSDDLLRNLAPVWSGVSGTDGNSNFSRPGAIIGLDRERPRPPAPLSQLVRDPAALSAAARVTPPTNGCATFASSIIQQSGVPIETIPGAQNLSNRLGRMGWQRIGVGDQQPGDVGVTEDHGQGAPGADHVYLVQSVDPDDPNRMRVVDNQNPMGGARAARGRGSRTPTSHFWRAPPPTMSPIQSPIQDSGIPPGPPTTMMAPPKMPPDLDRAINTGTTPDSINARWQGQVSMDLTFRDARGNVVQRRNAMTVSEPRIAGSGGNGPGLDRFSWNDSVTMPSYG